MTETRYDMNMSCSYGDDRDEAIVAFLYDDPDDERGGAGRVRGAPATCARCQAEVAALRGVRTQLAHWSPPEPTSRSAVRRATVPQSAFRQSAHGGGAIPAWAQVAAALLFLGVSAGIANLDVRYDQNGLSIRTGWSSQRRRAAAAGAGGCRATAARPATRPGRPISPRSSGS